MSDYTSIESLSKVFERGSANIIWCEHVLAMKNASGMKEDAWIAEYWNSWTNLAFVVAGILGLLRVASDMTKTAKLHLWGVLSAELTLMIGVGFGSFMFHAHQSRVAQIADELPMCLLTLFYNYALRGLHPLTTDPKYSGKFYGISLIFVVGLWAIYIYTGIYDVFVLCFSTQVVSTIALSWDAGRRVNHPTTVFYTGVSCLAFGKVLWEYERYLFRNEACDAPGTIWLHPLWHIGAALSHYCTMLNITNLNKRIHGNGTVASNGISNGHVKKD
ncbi:Pfam:aPHC [Seminavis robusta]|uniref:Pfam:aPHC n=1 Tax=Seminavis robusta TaxID=568900 RepID=A0A9N8EHH1_9STRA|nr:Pfam:aPHC [Seminavis robusta]|eukprot:Sro1011_g230980.1 Pfam:aPHC (274) ;mRNA; f:4009-4830